MKVFYKVILSFWVYVARLAQITQNNKFAISLKYINKKWKNEDDFLLAGKHQRFLQIDTIILGGQEYKNYRKKQVCYFYAIS